MDVDKTQIYQWLGSEIGSINRNRINGRLYYYNHGKDLSGSEVEFRVFS